MKKIIQIEIEYPDCDMLNILPSDLMVIQNEVMNQLSIVTDVAEGRFEINAKVIDSINEEELDKEAESLAWEFENREVTDMSYRDSMLIYYGLS